MTEPTPIATQSIWSRFKGDRLGMAGLGVLVLMGLMALFADFLAPYRPETQHRRLPNLPPMLTRIHWRWRDAAGNLNLNLTAPYVCAMRGARHPLTLEWVYQEDCTQTYPLKLFVRGEPYRLFGLIPADRHLIGAGDGPLFLWGTDDLGRDLLSRTLIGAQVSLSVGPIVVLISLLVGALLGGVSGYFGGRVDLAVQRLIELTLALPRLALLLALSAGLPSGLPPQGRYWAIVVLLCAVSWAPLAQGVRTQVLALREEDYVQAARALGAGHGHLIRRHLLPNAATTLIVSATLALPGLLILESVLSFFRFGMQEPLVSWGMLLQGAQSVSELQLHPWALLPGAFIVLAVMAFNFVGDALRDAADPRGRS